jgi:hypothetical protein
MPETWSSEGAWSRKRSFGGQRLAATRPVACGPPGCRWQRRSHCAPVGAPIYRPRLPNSWLPHAESHAAGGSSRLLAIEPPARYSAEPPGGIELGEEALREFLEGVFGAAATDQGATIPFARRERRGALPLCCPPHICGLPRIMSRPVPWTRPCITRKMP